MQSVVDELDVVVDLVEMRQEAVAERLQPEQAARLDEGVDARLVQPPQQLFDVAREHRRFAAGERDAAAGVAVEGQIAEEERQQLVDLPVAADPFESAGRADLGAGAAAVAERAVEGDGRARAERFRRADGHAVAASDAVLLEEGDLRAGADRFRVVAPDAGQGAALEEDGRADARAVVEGVRPHVDDQGSPALGRGFDVA